ILDKQTGAVVGQEPYYVEKDECNRADTTLEGLLKLPPHFDKDSGKGSVTAGNSSQLSDGASSTLVMSMVRAKALGIRPKLVFRGFAVAGCNPDEMGIGPVYAVPKLLQRNGLKIDDIDVWELNEAFASQVVYCRDRLGLDPEKLNVNGGSISIGHPFGMTGSRMVGTLANEMLRRKARYGIVTMCVGGRQGAAGLFGAYNRPAPGTPRGGACPGALAGRFPPHRVCPRCRVRVPLCYDRTWLERALGRRSDLKSALAPLVLLAVVQVGCATQTAP